MLPDPMQEFERNWAKERKIEFKIKKQAEKDREVQDGEGVSGRGVLRVYQNKTTHLFRAQLNIKSLWAREIWHSVIFAELQCKRSWEVKTERRSWAKRTKSVCCFSACWSWAESNLSVLFCATLEVCGDESLKDEVKGSIHNSQGPVPHYFCSGAARFGTELGMVPSVSDL